MRGCSRGGGRAWLLGGAWLLRGACMVAPRGVCGCSQGVRGCSGGAYMRGCSGGACMVAPGGVCVIALGGMHGIRRDTEIRSMRGRYASYWNAFLFRADYQRACIHL